VFFNLLNQDFAQFLVCLKRHKGQIPTTLSEFISYQIKSIQDQIQKTYKGQTGLQSMPLIQKKHRHILIGHLLRLSELDLCYIGPSYQLVMEISGRKIL